MTRVWPLGLVGVAWTKVQVAEKLSMSQLALMWYNELAHTQIYIEAWQGKAGKCKE